MGRCCSVEGRTVRLEGMVCHTTRVRVRLMKERRSAAMSAGSGGTSGSMQAAAWWEETWPSGNGADPTYPPTQQPA